MFSFLFRRANLFQGPRLFDSPQSGLFNPFFKSQCPQQLQFRQVVTEVLPPRRTRTKKCFKGRVPVPIGGSLTGCLLTKGDYGIFPKEGVRIRTNQLEAARRAIRRYMKKVKGGDMFLRIHPNIPVTAKPREVPMGGGKGGVDHYIARVQMNRIIFEIKGTDLRPELARMIMWQGAQKLPGKIGFIAKTDQRHLEMVRKSRQWPDGFAPPYAPPQYDEPDQQQQQTPTI